MKIFIHDPLKRLHGEEETQITESNAVRFELDGKEIRFKITPTGIEVMADRSISIRPIASNCMVINSED